MSAAEVQAGIAIASQIVERPIKIAPLRRVGNVELGGRLVPPETQRGFLNGISRPARYIARRLVCDINVNAALAERAFEGTGSALAKSFLQWGQSRAPTAGAVAVYNRKGGGHVASSVVSRTGAPSSGIRRLAARAGVRSNTEFPDLIMFNARGAVVVLAWAALLLSYSASEARDGMFFFEPQLKTTLVSGNSTQHSTHPHRGGTNTATEGYVHKCNFLEEHMKRSLLIACIGLLVATTASAQNPPAQSGPNNNAVNSSGQNNANAPVAGRNSFTEGQAKSRIEEAGYTNVSDLKKDDNGVWRGRASKNGSSAEVSVDFQGNINAAN